MDTIPFEIKNIIDRYLHQLKVNNIRLKRAYLFGSYSKGNFNEYSDIDLALISDFFEGNRMKDREKIRKITLSVSSHLEVLPFNTEDFTSENPLAQEIMETGIELPIN
jgi:predicted nucleotidyltransferase